MTRLNRASPVLAAVLAAALVPAALAQTGSFDAVANNFVWVGAPNAVQNPGDGLWVHYDGSLTSRIRKSYIKFELPAESVVEQAEFIVSLKSFVGTGSHTFKVVGLTDPELEEWQEVYITWNNAPANNVGGNGFLSESVTVIGEFTAESADPAGTVYSVGGAALVEFLNANPRESVTLMLYRTTGGNHHEFHSIETGVPGVSVPRLDVTFADPTPPPPPPEPDDLEVLITQVHIHPGGAEKVSVQAVLVPDPAFSFDPAADGVAICLIRHGETNDLFYPLDPAEMPVFLDLVIDEPALRVWSMGAAEKSRTGINSLEIVDDDGLITFKLVDTKTGLPDENYGSVSVVMSVGQHVGGAPATLSRNSSRGPWTN